MRKSKAKLLRTMIERVSEWLSDEDALQAVELFPAWKTDTAYKTDERIRYNGVLYRVEQAHTSQSDWTPDITPALYTEVAEPGEIPVWKQPTGAQDAYQIGDMVYYPDKDGNIYRSVIDSNIWSPEQFPQGWEMIENE